MTFPFKETTVPTKPEMMRPRVIVVGPKKFNPEGVFRKLDVLTSKLQEPIILVRAQDPFGDAAGDWALHRNHTLKRYHVEGPGRVNYDHRDDEMVLTAEQRKPFFLLIFKSAVKERIDDFSKDMMSRKDCRTRTIVLKGK